MSADTNLPNRQTDAAQIALARDAENGNDHQTARSLYLNAARTGSIEALRLLGTNLLVHPPQSWVDGIGMMRQAAQRGDAEAMHFCAVLAANDPELNDRWTIALDYLQQAAEHGHAHARKQLLLLSGSGGDDWKMLRSTIDIETWLALPPVESAHILSISPAIRSFDRFLSPALCDWIVESARGRTRPATVYGGETGTGNRMESLRTNSHAGFSVADCDLVLMLIRARIAAASNTAQQGHEWPMALHYRSGEEYKAHYDFLDVSLPPVAQEVRHVGQRVATFLIYLNDDFEGGETEFPKLDLRYRGRKGDALLFFNIEAGKADARTLHAGRAPTRGEKWLYSQWIREHRIRA